MAAAATPDERLRSALVLGHALARDNRFAEAVEVLDRAAAAPGGRRRAPGPRRRGAGGEHGDVLARDGAGARGADPGRARGGRRGRGRAATSSSRSPGSSRCAPASPRTSRRDWPCARSPPRAARSPAPTDLPWFHQCAITLLWAERYAELQGMLDDAVGQRPRARRRRASSRGTLAYRSWLVAAARRPARGRGRRPHRDRGGEPAGAADVPAVRHGGARRRRSPSAGELDEAEAVLAPVEAHVEGDSTICGAAAGQPRPAAARQRRDAEALADLLRAGEVARATGLDQPELPAVALAGRARRTWRWATSTRRAAWRPRSSRSRGRSARRGRSGSRCARPG